MSTAIIIPARHASTRLPGKPLLKETGKYLIQHVYERAWLARRAARVIVATDDPRIAAAVAGFGGEVRLTRRDHASGTDRIAEVAADLDDDVLVNLQGDEPLIEPAALDLLMDHMARDPSADMATLACPVASAEAWHSPNVVKVVLDDRGNALYFSRAPIPFVRDGAPDFASRPARFLQHIGLYAYRRPFLHRFAAAPPAPLEQLEKLEQLRALALGCRIGVGLIDRPTLGVDTYEDYRRFVAAYRLLQTSRAA